MSLHAAVYLSLRVLHGVRASQETGKNRSFPLTLTTAGSLLWLIGPTNFHLTLFSSAMGLIFRVFNLVQFEYQQAQLEAEIENLSWKVERADTYERGVVGGEGELSASDRGVRACASIHSHSTISLSLTFSGLTCSNLTVPCRNRTNTC